MAMAHGLGPTTTHTSNHLVHSLEPLLFLGFIAQCLIQQDSFVTTNAVTSWGIAISFLSNNTTLARLLYRFFLCCCAHSMNKPFWGSGVRCRRVGIPHVLGSSETTLMVSNGDHRGHDESLRQPRRVHRPQTPTGRGAYGCMRSVFIEQSPLETTDQIFLKCKHVSKKRYTCLEH